MRLYCLQIKDGSKPDSPDEMYIFSDIENMKREYENKFRYYKTAAEETIHDTYPDEDDDGVRGAFTFGFAEGYLVRGLAYDYDVLDDE